MEPRIIPHDPPRSYGRASVYGDLIFLAGETSLDHDTGEIVGSTVAEQAEVLFGNLARSLEKLDSSLARVIKITAFLKDPRDRAQYQAARTRFLPHAPPGTLIMGVQLAEPAMLIEIEAVAVVDRG
jgi:enamine deaminase RidA (YjgF/YER057c/UK114 family)